MAYICCRALLPSGLMLTCFYRYSWGEGENNWGIIVTGNISIEFDTVGQIGNTIITPECPMTGYRFEMFSKIAVAAKKNGSVVIGQVVHPGRQVLASINPEPISASNVQLCEYTRTRKTVLLLFLSLISY